MTRPFLLTLLLTLNCLVTPGISQESPPETLGATLENFRERYGFPGVTAAIILPNGTLVKAAAGLADPDSGRAMAPDTPMLAASIGKTLVATTVLDLEDAALLSREDPLSAYLGKRPWFDTLPNANSITLGQLLNHTSGLPDHVHLPEFARDWAQLTTSEGDFEPEQLLAFVAGEDPLFEAGEAWAYSDTGYVLLGLVIEVATGTTWHETVRTRLLDPLGLRDTIPSDRPDLPGLAVGYVDPGNPYGLPARTADENGRLVWNPAVEFSGGGFASTSADLARWGHLLYGGEALEAPYLDRLLDGVPVGAATPDVLYGPGVAIYNDTPRGPVYGHGGWIPGYVSSLRHYAAHGVTVAFQINTDIGVADDSSDLVPALEAALADLAISMTPEPMTMAWLTLFGATLTLLAAMTSAGMMLFPSRWRKLEVWAYGGRRRPWPVLALALVLLVLWTLALLDFAQRPAGDRNWAGWTLVIAVPVLWVVKSAALVFNARGRAAVSSISSARSWRRIGLARLPIALVLAALAWLA